ncbi:hypothetical protein EDD85DRAFT_795604 [Armillaria nabsnona]|nr:hypothetical protein EDD85DRAFT_795604 [Armillaria nabsnona]
MRTVTDALVPSSKIDPEFNSSLPGEDISVNNLEGSCLTSGTKRLYAHETMLLQCPTTTSVTQHSTVRIKLALLDIAPVSPRRQQSRLEEYQDSPLPRLRKNGAINLAAERTKRLAHTTVSDSRWAAHINSCPCMDTKLSEYEETGPLLCAGPVDVFMAKGALDDPYQKYMFWMAKIKCTYCSIQTLHRQTVEDEGSRGYWATSDIEDYHRAIPET